MQGIIKELVINMSESIKSSFNNLGCTIMGKEITPTLVSGQYKMSGNTQDGLSVIGGWKQYAVCTGARHGKSS